jgi:hypothetical protein
LLLNSIAARIILIARDERQFFQDFSEVFSKLMHLGVNEACRNNAPIHI